MARKLSRGCWTTLTTAHSTRPPSPKADFGRESGGGGGRVRRDSHRRVRGYPATHHKVRVPLCVVYDLDARHDQAGPRVHRASRAHAAARPGDGGGGRLRIGRRAPDSPPALRTGRLLAAPEYRGHRPRESPITLPKGRGFARAAAAKSSTPEEGFDDLLRSSLAGIGWGLRRGALKNAQWRRPGAVCPGSDRSVRQRAPSSPRTDPCACPAPPRRRPGARRFFFPRTPPGCRRIRASHLTAST